MIAILIFFVAHWYLSLFFQTFFLHRYAAHKMFSMSKVWERIFYILTYITQGSSYLSPYAYGILHRLHHAYADTEQDPHSPSYSSGLFDMMWKTKVAYSKLLARADDVERKFKKNLPDWQGFDNFANAWPSRVAWMLLYTLFYIYFIHGTGSSPWWAYFFYLLLPLQFVMGPLHGAIINWYAHRYGTVNFDINDTSKNLFPVDVLMFGEAYHNNHHRFPNDARFGKKRFEFDPAYPFIKLFDKLGIIRLNRKK